MAWRDAVIFPQKYLKNWSHLVVDDHGALRHGLPHVAGPGRRGDYPQVVRNLTGLQARHVVVRVVGVGHLLGAVAPYFQGRRVPGVLGLESSCILYFPDVICITFYTWGLLVDGLAGFAVPAELILQGVIATSWMLSMTLLSTAHFTFQRDTFTNLLALWTCCELVILCKKDLSWLTLIWHSSCWLVSHLSSSDIVAYLK